MYAFINERRLLINILQLLEYVNKEIDSFMNELLDEYLTMKKWRKSQRRKKRMRSYKREQPTQWSLWTPSQRVKDFWMTPGGGPQPVGINHVARTDISQTWPSDDGLAVDFVTHPFIGWAINWPSMGVARRLTSENEWGVWGGERWALSPALVCWVIPGPECCHAIIHQSHD